MLNRRPLILTTLDGSARETVTFTRSFGEKVIVTTALSLDGWFESDAVMSVTGAATLARDLRAGGYTLLASPAPQAEEEELSEAGWDGWDFEDCDGPVEASFTEAEGRISAEYDRRYHD